MKPFFIFPIFFISVLCFARPGDTCDEAIALFPEPSCALQAVELSNRNNPVVVQNHPDAFLGSRFIWYSFVATHDKVTVNFEANTWLNLALIDGCQSNNIYTALQVYTHFSDAQVEKISFNNLEIGKTYYLLFNLDGINEFFEPASLNFCLSQYKIDVSDCPGALVICSDGNINFSPKGPGFSELPEAGCLIGENQSVWYLFGIREDAPANMSLTFELTPVNEQADYDFAIYGPSATCTDLGTPVRCSYANRECLYCPSTGLSDLVSDASEDAQGDGFVAPLTVNPGEVYLLVVDNYDGLGSEFSLDWGGEAASYLNCEAKQVDCLDELSDFSYRVNSQGVIGRDTVLRSNDILYINTDNNNRFSAGGGVAFALFDADPDTMAADLQELNMYYPDENPNFLGFLPFKSTLYVCDKSLIWEDRSLSGDHWIVPITVDYIDEATGTIELDRNTDNCFEAGAPFKISTRSATTSCGESIVYKDTYGQCGNEILYEICPDADKWVNIQVDSFRLEEDSLLFEVNGLAVGFLTGNGKNRFIQHTELNECIQIRMANAHSDIKGSWFYASVECKDPCSELPTAFDVNKQEVCAFEPFVLEATKYDSITYFWRVPDGVQIDSGQGTPNIGLTWNEVSGQVVLEIQSECGLVDEFNFSIAVEDRQKPIFNFDTLYCRTDSQQIILPATDLNGVTGTWSESTFEPYTLRNRLVTTFTADHFCADDTTVTIELEEEPTLQFLDTICSFNPEQTTLIVDVEGEVQSSVGTVTKQKSGNFEISEIPFDTPFQLTVLSDIGCLYTFSVGAINCIPPCDIEASVELQHPTCNDSLGYITIGNASGGVEPYFYSIDNGIPSFIQNYRNLNPGDHTVKIRDKYGCQFEETVTIKEIVEPIINMPDTISITTAETVPLTINHGKSDDAILSIEFDPILPFECVNGPCSQVDLRAKESFSAVLTFQDTDECLVRDSFFVWVLDKEDIHFPNIIERNSGFNGYLAPYGNVKVDNVELSVFDRWGGQIAYLPDVKLNSPVTGWNGEVGNSGDSLPSGTYIYVATVTYHSGLQKILSGDVLVIGE